MRLGAGEGGTDDDEGGRKGGKEGDDRLGKKGPDKLLLSLGVDVVATVGAAVGKGCMRMVVGVGRVAGCGD